ncbi:MAG: XRE family transcriptional regulator [Planctomycetes bacterium]|nr:XRE family transcriptional regulator [Planctomycetota bacterium]
MSKKTKSSIRSSAIRKAYDRYVGKSPRRRAYYADELANSEIARKIFMSRTQAGLSQRALAKLVGTTASVICQLEDSDYEGHSLSMLHRIAAALNKRVEIRFLPASPRRRTA